MNFVLFYNVTRQDETFTNLLFAHLLLLFLEIKVVKKWAILFLI